MMLSENPSIVTLIQQVVIARSEFFSDEAISVLLQKTFVLGLI
jgi:hypothetical protein